MKINTREIAIANMLDGLVKSSKLFASSINFELNFDQANVTIRPIRTAPVGGGYVGAVAEAKEEQIVDAIKELTAKIGINLEGDTTLPTRDFLLKLEHLTAIEDMKAAEVQSRSRRY